MGRGGYVYLSLWATLTANILTAIVAATVDVAEAMFRTEGRLRGSWYDAPSTFTGKRILCDSHNPRA